MPIEKELTHDCVWLFGARMSYQYVGGGVLNLTSCFHVRLSLLRFLCSEFCSYFSFFLLGEGGALFSLKSQTFKAHSCRASVHVCPQSGVLIPSLSVLHLFLFFFFPTRFLSSAVSCKVFVGGGGEKKNLPFNAQSKDFRLSFCSA